MQEPVVVLSPHLDDAVLSAWHVLSSPRDVTIVTVFAGVPEPGLLTDLDRSHGAGDSGAWLTRRRQEDRAAFAVAGRDPVHLDLLEVQFPAYRIPRLRDAIARAPERFLELVADDPELRSDPDALAALVRPHIPPGAVVYGPAGIGGHPDHRDLAQATVLLDGDVRLYADSPYYLRLGLPSWAGHGGEPELAADAWVMTALSRLDAKLTGPEVAELSPDVFDQKVAAMRCYTTEFPAIWRDASRPPAEPGMMRFEPTWVVAGGR
ncbi:MAG TPA: PIG-L family deacetylase [Streptosporangiaceae bacterium]|nr:PIG-L family deacetylase [Streptosporangiaceae bacterium]